MEFIITEEQIEDFRSQLTEEEKSDQTIKKYVRDVLAFRNFTGETAKIKKARMREWKDWLIDNFAPTTVNAMLASVNGFFKRTGHYECTVKELKIQKAASRSADRDLTKEDYLRLIEEARKKGKIRLALIIETLGSTGMRIGELRFLTVESAVQGAVRVNSKGKLRRIVLPEELCRKLLDYTGERKSGCIFITRTGRPVDRSNIFHEMKKLSEAANVQASKIFPHNLRHLFAITYYKIHRDLSHLADLLGHSNINTTRIYTLISDREHEKSINKLGLVL